MQPQPAQHELVSQGAEACMLFGHPAIVKERFSKKYRHPALDVKLTRTRIVQEARSFLRANKAGVPTPILYFADTEANRLYMQYIHGMTVKAFLWSNPAAAVREDVVKRLGLIVAQMHAHDIIHGDLTTSNFMLNQGDNNRVVAIDFGLSSQSNLAEDKAVDLYVLERAFLSSHPNSEALFALLLKSYEDSDKVNPKMKAVMNKLEEGI